MPISGWTGANIFNAPTDDPDDPDKETHNITWQTEAGTVYGGYVDPVTGVLTVTHGIKTVTSTHDISRNDGQRYYIDKSKTGAVVPSSDTPSVICDKLKSEYGHFYDNRVWLNSSGAIRWNTTTDYTTIADMLSDFGGTLTFVYPLATPITYQLDPVTIKTLLSNPNNIWADTGDISISYKADTKSYVDQHEGVTDVQVGGVSVLNQGVANVPVADSSHLGVMKVDSAYGLGLISAQTPTACISAASESLIKQGTNGFKPIVPLRQHESVFYALAKLANADMASLSSVTVGQYPEAQKIAIQKMLGLPNTKGELIYETTATEDLTELVVDVDSNGLPFVLTKIIAIFTAPASTTGNKDSFFGTIKGKSGSNLGEIISFPSLTYPTATSVMTAKIFIEVHDGMPIETRVAVGTSDGTTVNTQEMSKLKVFDYINYFKIYQSGSTKSLIPAGTNLKLYGIRKW